MTSFTAPLRSLTLIALAAGMAQAATIDVTSVAPNYGIDDGGTVVVITGTGFDDVNVVGEITFGGTAAASIVSRSNTQLVVTTPAKAAGAYTLRVDDDAGGAGGDDAPTSFVYYETAATSVAVNVSVTIAQDLFLAWTAASKHDAGPNGTGGDAVTEGSTTALNWSLGTVALGQEVTTVGNHATYYFQVRNTGNGAEDITVHESSAAGVAWSRSADMSAGANEYVLAATADGTTWLPLSGVLDGSSVDVAEDLATDAVKDVDLKFQAPLSVTVFGTKTMVVTITATTPD